MWELKRIEFLGEAFSLDFKRLNKSQESVISCDPITILNIFVDLQAV